MKMNKWGSIFLLLAFLVTGCTIKIIGDNNKTDIAKLYDNELVAAILNCDIVPIKVIYGS